MFGKFIGCNNEFMFKPKLVFLGGACGETTWRQDKVIPKLKSSKIPYFNPQVKEWSESLMEKENDAKKNADVLLFVFDSSTRCIATLAEVAFYAARGRRVVIVMQEYIGEHEDEVKDVNRGRRYLKEEVKSCPNTSVFFNIEDAIEFITQKAA